MTDTPGTLKMTPEDRPAVLRIEVDGRVVFPFGPLVAARAASAVEGVRPFRPVIRAAVRQARLERDLARSEHQRKLTRQVADYWAGVVQTYCTRTENPEVVYTDGHIRTQWLAAGGRFHGPNIETGTLEEAKLLPYLRGLFFRIRNAENLNTTLQDLVSRLLREKTP